MSACLHNVCVCKKMEEAILWRGPLTRCYYSEHTIGGNEGAGKSSERGGLGFEPQREHKLFLLVIAGPLLLSGIFPPQPNVNIILSSCHLCQGHNLDESSWEKQYVEWESELKSIMANYTLHDFPCTIVYQCNNSGLQLFSFAIMSMYIKNHNFMKDHILLS